MPRSRPSKLPGLQGLPALLALLALFAALVIAAAVYHGLRLRNETLGTYRDVATNLMRVGERELTGTLALVERTLASRGENWLSIVADPQGDARLREDIAELPALRSLSIVDAQGRILASSTAGSRGRQLSSDAMAALIGPANIPVHVSPPWAGRDLPDGTPARAPLERGNSPSFFTLTSQSYQAAADGPVWLVAAVNPDFFAGFLAATADRSEFAVELFRYDGVLLTSTQAHARAPGYSATNHPVFREWLPDREIGLIDPDLTQGEGAPQILAFRASRRYPLVLQVRLPHEAVLQGWRDEVQRLTQGTAAVLLFVMLLTWLLYRQQQRRRTAEEEIRAEIELAARVFESSYDGVLITDAQSRIVRVNPAFTAMTGYTPDDVLGKTPQILSSGQQDAAFYQAMWDEIRQHGQWQGEITNRRKDGSPLPERLAITTVTDAGGRITHYIGTFADISERKRQEVELQQARDRAEAANQAKSQFLAVMSHEIRTPMNGILGMAQLLQTPQLSPAEQREYATTIFHSGRVLLTLLNDILDLSKVEAGKMELARAPADPVQVLQEVAALFAEAARHKGLALHTDWQDLPHRCYDIDAIRLRQMLTNLLNNAIKFTDRGEVRLRALEVARQDGVARLRFEVIDTGMGIAPERQAELFQPFAQVDNSSTRRFGGTGLGLSIVASLARLMDGEVGVDSVQGQGSRFWFTLAAHVLTPPADTLGRLAPGPARAASPNPAPASAPMATAAPAAQAATGADSTEAWILVAEDNLVNQKVVQAMLKRLGRPLRMVQNGEEAVQSIQRGDLPGLVLMDCQMPVMDGYEATRQIRQWQQSQRQAGLTPPEIPIVALTAGAFETEREACLAAGMDDFLAKPLEIGVLRALVNKWMPAHARPAPPA